MLIAFLRYSLEKQPENLEFQSIFASKRTSVATGNKTLAPIFKKKKKNDAKFAQFITDASVFLVSLIHFALQKNALKMVFCLPLKEPLVATFSKKCRVTSRKHVTQSGLIIPNLSGDLKFFLWHFFVFALAKYLQNTKFSEFFK